MGGWQVFGWLSICGTAVVLFLMIVARTVEGVHGRLHALAERERREAHHRHMAMEAAQAAEETSATTANSVAKRVARNRAGRFEEGG